MKEKKLIQEPRKTCGNCKYFRFKPGSQVEGNCHNHENLKRWSGYPAAELYSNQHKNNSCDHYEDLNLATALHQTAQILTIMPSDNHNYHFNFLCPLKRL